MRAARGPLTLAALLAINGGAACAGRDADSSGAGEPVSPALEAESLMVVAMGGRDAWESARLFEFVWAVDRGDAQPLERRHVWDRWTGRYRLEMPLQNETRMLAIFDANTVEGRVWVDGVELSGDTVGVLLARAHAVYINDTYWFIMPFKWRDPGVNLVHLGISTDSAGKEWETVELTFENVGRTPNNRYRAYIDPATQRMGWWEHFRNRVDTTTNTRTLWSQWERRGPIMVSLDRPFVTPAGERTGRRIYFPSARIATTVDESVFAPPEP
jgi:hypothetical protein